MSTEPEVSVIVPCFNEQNTILLLLEALYEQTYPRQQMEVVIADGMSTDGTREQILAFQQERLGLPIRVVDNPGRTIPAGLNQAINAARGEIIVRLDAHSVPRPDYVACCVMNLEKDLGDIVGGVWEICPRGTGWQARSIAVAAAHPLGVGDARYRFTNRAQKADTVPFGAFKRTLIDKICLYDENLQTNEDYEFNTRVRLAGGKIWLDPDIRSKYFARGSFFDLAQQYWRYGFWKVRMLRSYPTSIRWRQALPPLFVLSLLVLMILSIWLPIALWVIVIELSAYALVLLLVGLKISLTNKDIGLVLGVPLAIAVMHFSWGSAFLWSLIFR